jgi:hypothetical protein
MKMLLSTTALVLALGVPVMTAAQTQAPGANPGNMQRDGGCMDFWASAARPTCSPLN